MFVSGRNTNIFSLCPYHYPYHLMMVQAVVQVKSE
nr:MAG TPA: hypothetical protein [Caudoviricetes sp.]